VKKRKKETAFGKKKDDWDEERIKEWTAVVVGERVKAL